jgi:hypothetical protein
MPYHTFDFLKKSNQGYFFFSRKRTSISGIMLHACNSTTQEMEAECHEFKASLGDTVR